MTFVAQRRSPGPLQAIWKLFTPADWSWVKMTLPVIAERATNATAPKPHITERISLDIEIPPNQIEPKIEPARLCLPHPPMSTLMTWGPAVLPVEGIVWTLPRASRKPRIMRYKLTDFEWAFVKLTAIHSWLRAK